MGSLKAMMSEYKHIFMVPLKENHLNPSICDANVRMGSFQNYNADREDGEVKMD